MTLSELYGALTQQPILHDGSILSVIEGRELSFQLSFKHQDHLAKKKQTSIESISLNPDIFNPFNLERLDVKESGDTLFECVKPEALYLWTAPTILNDCVQETSISPSGTLRALFMSAEQEDCKSKKLTWIELWQKNYRVAIIRTTDTYSDLYHDSSIGSFSWNKAETKLAFIAAPSLAKKSDTELDPQEYQDKYEHFSSYGENYIDLRPPCIFIADFRKCSVSPIQLDVDPLQVIFASSSGDILMAKDEDILSSDEALYLVGLDVRRFPRRPGIFACPNRPTQIYRYQASKFVKIVTTGFESIPKIRMNGPDTTQIFFLSGKSGGPHRAGHKLVKYDIMSGECSVIVDLVEEPNFEKGEFPGLYLFGMEFPRNPFLLQKDSTWMVMSSIWGFRITTLLINTETKEIIHLTPNPAFCSWTVLDVKDGYILAVYESFITLPKPMIGKVDLSYITASKSNSINIATESNSLAIKWRSLDRRKPGLFGFVDDHIGVFDWLAMNTEIEPHWHQGETDSFESLLLYPRNYLPFEPSRRITVSSSVESKMALIVSPHGGPHSTFTHKWETRVAGYLAMGHAVLLVNYRGSLGYGEKYLYDIIGKIGDLEVKETHIATLDILKWYSEIINPKKVTLIGGSHGGWIGAHLTMRYPETFALMILMNPVTDLILDINVSDIPDWSMFESGHPFDFHSPSLSLTLKDLEALFPINPAVYFKVHDKFPKTKIILGYKDKRAPMPNGLRWHEFITGKGLDSKTFILPDTGHSLAGYEQEKATFVMLLNFLNEIN